MQMSRSYTERENSTNSFEYHDVSIAGCVILIIMKLVFESEYE
jgi:hypothetical protein